jgi:hypothetical protein
VNGSSTSFLGDRFTLLGQACPTAQRYDAANASGTAVRTHSYKSGATTGLGAVIMNKNTGNKWNTVWQGFPWFDMRTASDVGPASPDEEEILAGKILAQTLPLSCQQSSDPSTGNGDDQTDALPRVPALAQNVPNPFNPTTTITFDLPRPAEITVVIYDVAGHVVKTVARGRFEAGFRIPVTWTGLDAAGNRVPSGVYFYRLVTPDFTATRKMVLLK